MKMTWSLDLGSPSRSLAKQTLIKDLLVSTPPSPVSWAAQWSSHFTSLSSAAHLSLYSSLISATSALLLTCPPTSSPCPCPAARPLQWLINLRNSGGCSHLISRSTSLASCLIYQTYLMMSYMGGR